MKRVQDCHAGRARRLGRGERRRACASGCPPTSSSSTTSSWAAPSARPSGARYVVKAHGSELEYSMRGQRRALGLGAGGLAGAGGDDRRLGAHPRGRSPTSAGRRSDVHEIPPGVDVELWEPAAEGRGARGAARRVPPGPAEPGERQRAAPGRGQRRPARHLPRGRPPDRRLLREADREQGRPDPLRGAPRSRRTRRHRRLRRLPGRARAPRGGPRRPLHRPARAPAPRPPARARGRVGRALDLPGGLRHGRGRVGRRRLPADRGEPLRPRRDRAGPRARTTRRSCGTCRASRAATPTSSPSG